MSCHANVCESKILAWLVEQVALKIHFYSISQNF